MTEVEVVEYDPRWPELAALAIAGLRAALPGVFVEAEHIGSTAVPGLAAKPVIDLMAAVGDFAEVEAGEGRLADLGYERHVNTMTDRLLYFGMAGGRRTSILHVVSLESWPTRNQRILRDHLRGHPRDLERYAELKRRIASSGVPLDDYTRAKTELIQEITDRARAARGLPSVPVWEM
ncbi:GrpB family protein [Actinocorallia longicatena]|uniref:GrpB family protein n=1 Tax=Actinocorallia longicatena TaxID=111803 RepID=A0ABP6PYZ7_9ACTN